jgi:hypothetical protein
MDGPFEARTLSLSDNSIVLSCIDGGDGLMPCPRYSGKGQPGVELTLAPAGDTDLDMSSGFSHNKTNQMH